MALKPLLFTFSRYPKVTGKMNTTGKADKRPFITTCCILFILTHNICHPILFLQKNIPNIDLTLELIIFLTV